ncbi:DinB family protein [Actinopolymorpha sp. B9G3]|uniref:DinB family protein n=1 Tax=Actinopolymorpha sp. B9G3 TaxID=3158970 RepID=UPI0032D9136C
MDDKEYLHRWLRMMRDVMLWKLEGLSDADVRRPMTRSGTNLLGLVKHITHGEIRNLGEAFGRPATDVRLPWWDAENVQKTHETSGDMYAAPGESTEYIVDLYRRACAHADQTIAELDLDDIGTIPDGETLTLRQALVHTIHETSRHAGHADIVRELIDGSIGGARDNPFVPDPDDDAYWQDYLARVTASAEAAEQTSERP